ncbi:uncharacterized protein LOC129596042 [Paramacrobiotus metropolitanus]|uniref:uncharacterized protein LOC129596042 n=1 Tax=Paramacrobiotus metropolitanus TaxID=2943436 RepID=UPI0024456413|nr:uncharacterized protein LOC129596042 [Paramacrobiotus metropolitanus]
MSAAAGLSCDNPRGCSMDNGVNRTRRTKAENEQLSLAKLRIIVKVNPWQCKENTKESGSLWRKIVGMCRANGVPMNYTGSLKTPAHTLQEMVSRSIKAFHRAHPHGPPAEKTPASWTEKDQLVHQIIQWKALLRAQAAAKDRNEGMELRERESGTDSGDLTAVQPARGSGNGLPLEAPSASRSHSSGSVEPFDTAFEYTDNGAVESDEDVELSTPERDVRFRPMPDSKPATVYYAALANPLLPKNLRLSNSTDGGGAIADMLSKIVVALNESNEIQRRRLQESKEARVAQEKFQREQAEAQREQADKDRALKLQMAHIEQEADLQKFKLLLEHSKK